jgi:Flp pilus assembly protein TadG
VRRGQALVELAICVPVVMLLALGGAAVVQIADAKTGLEAATQAAVAAASRAPNPASAQAAAQERFASMVASYPLRSASLMVSFGGFERSAQVNAISQGSVDVGWAFLLPIRTPVVLEARATARLESWRSRRASA